jgi:hypothetical protein
VEYSLYPGAKKVQRRRAEQNSQKGIQIEEEKADEVMLLYFWAPADSRSPVSPSMPLADTSAAVAFFRFCTSL